MYTIWYCLSFFFFSSRRRHTRCSRDWSSDVCSSDLVAHVPKTIDNDLPLPSDIDTFVFSTACNLGKDLVRNLMQDAATTERWFFVTVMEIGRASCRERV